MNFANLYRPSRFEDVVGQRDAVRILSGLALRRKTRNILLSGAYGSGKTSMARILARAWNCNNPTNMGSPCGSCSNCAEEHGRSMFECVVTTMNGSKEDVRGILNVWNRPSPDHRVRTIFFDEAHGLQESGAEALLDAAENPMEGVSILFATTKPWAIAKALKSRLFEVKVQALSQVDSVSLLRSIASRAGISCDTDALLLLASLKKGHPRDLVSGLEQVSIDAEHVDVDVVKRCFDIDQEEFLVNYFTALSNGDATSQHRALREWNEPIASQVRWIRSYLLSFYHRNILAQHVMVDPAVDSMNRARSNIAQSFCGRLGFNTVDELEPFWRRLLNFWVVHSDKEEVVLRLRLTLFEDLVNRGSVASVEPEQIGPTSGFRGSSLRRAHAEMAKTPTTMFPGGRQDSHKRVMFGSADLALIINHTSYFTQHYGRYVNAYFEVTPTISTEKSDADAITTIIRFSQDLESLIGPDDEVALITILDKVPSGVIGKVIAVIPDYACAGAGLTSLQEWCDQWTLDGVVGHHIATDFARKSGDRRFHWGAIGRVAARIHDADQSSSEGVPSLGSELLRALKVKAETGYIGALDRSPVILSKTINHDAISLLTELAMPFLSAVDDGALDWLTVGWELVEYSERSRELLSREQQLQDIEDTFENSHERAEAREALLREWPRDAKLRPRKSGDWWWR